MSRGLFVILSAVGAVAGVTLPAVAQDGSSNPLDVTWEVNAPDTMTSLPFALSSRSDVEIRAVPLHILPQRADPGPSSASGAWSEETRFQDCAIDPACSDAPARVGLRLRSDGTGGVKFGALVRFGEDLSKPRSSSDRSWRFFAAADAHALTWDFNGNDGESLRLEEDRVVVGDAQVGVSRPLMRGDLALGYIHREVSAEGASRAEQFGGITFSMAH